MFCDCVWKKRLGKGEMNENHVDIFRLVSLIQAIIDFSAGAAGEFNVKTRPYFTPLASD